jgi:hypothetical protein
MSAFAYINIEDVPANIRESAAIRKDDITGARLIAYEGCPLVGEASVDDLRVEYPFPRNAQIRGDLVAWFMNWGIHFRVVM